MIPLISNAGSSDIDSWRLVITSRRLVNRVKDAEEEIAMGSDVDDAAEVRDRDVQLGDGSTTRLSRLWAEGPLVLVFLRHYG